MKKINGWLYAFWIALIVILIMALAVGLISWAGSGAEENADGGDDEGGGDVETYDNTQSFEAEDAYLMNAVGASGSTSLLGTEDSSSFEGVTQVKNFNEKDDKIVFQLLASEAVEDVELDAIVTPTSDDFDASEHAGFIAVNGVDAGATGIVEKSTYGAVSATVDLNEGINYVEITLDVSGSSFLGMNLGYMNVDRIDLSWDGSATIEAVNDYTSEVFDVDATGVATLEAEDAALFNSMDSLANSYELLGIEDQDELTSVAVPGVTDVKNFNVSGDKIVFQINAAAAIENVKLDLYAWASATGFRNYSYTDYPNLITVNGEKVEYSDAIVSVSNNTIVPVTASISLLEGINYIEITLEKTGTRLSSMNTGGINVDRIDLNGGTYKEPATVVSSADELVEALEEGGDIVLTTDITVGTTASEEDTAALTVSEDTEIDLAGKSITTGTLSSALNTIEVEEGATLTITDSTGDGTIANTYGTHTSVDNAAAIEVNGGDLIIESGTISSSSVGVRALSGSVTIDGGTVTSTGYYALWEGEGQVDVTINGGVVGGSYAGILVDGDSCFGYGDYNYQYGAVTKLTITGGVVYSGGEGQAAIRTEGMTSTDSAIITIEGGLVYGAGNAPGIFMANGTLKVTDGTIAGSTAVEVQAGVTTISGGIFYATGTEQTVDTSSSNNASYTNGYALSIIPRGYIVRCTDTNDDSANFSMALDVTITGGTFYGDIYVRNGATSSSATGDWTVVLNGTDEGKANANYVVDITAITLTPYDSSKQEITDPNSATDVAYYLYAVDSKLAAIDATADANDLIYSGTGQDAKSVEGYSYEIVISTDVSDGSVKYTLVGEAGTMDASLASWFGKGAAEGDAYVTVKLYVGSENTISYTSAGGEDKTYDSNEFTSDGYYIFAYRLTGTLDDGTAVSPSSAKVYTVKDSSGNELYTVTIDYTQITITEATVEG